MYSITVTVTNKAGLHARPAALFAQAAAKFQATVTIRKGEQTGDAKSILKILSLGISQGSDIVLSAEGPDERTAVETLAGLLESGLGE